eukprot:TRINITY_DN8313_c0_g1_i4.p1 TRINITY_DN8313_c0_g1~~TRINITY_DN8313_c0_g1_i4.p1  ORF type:complete len:455 (-),score=104.49 TRINITY_DN8313_c0_g1_i4:54-1355(-)
MPNLFLSLLILHCIVPTFAESADALLFSIVFIRHGARSGRSKKVSIENVTWAEGNDALTPSGTRQLYLLGRMMRDYYITQRRLLPPHYNGSLMHVQSSHSARTLMSGQSFLLGLYPKEATKLTEDQAKDRRHWTPPNNYGLDEEDVRELKDSSLIHDIPLVPVMDYARVFERMLSFNFCDLFYHYRKMYYTTKDFAELYREYNVTFQQACYLAKLNCTYLQGKDVWDHVDALVAAEFDGKLPQISHLAEELDQFYTKAEIGEMSYNRTFQSSIAMNQFSELVPEYLENATRSATPLKMLVLSAHESTLLSFLAAMNVSFELYKTVPYASNFIIELLKTDRGEYKVNVTLNSKQLFVKPLAEFTKWVKELGKVEGKWQDICKLPTAQLKTLESTSALIPTVAGILATLIVIEVLLWLRKRKRRTESPLLSQITV